MTLYARPILAVLACVAGPVIPASQGSAAPVQGILDTSPEAVEIAKGFVTSVAKNGEIGSTAAFGPNVLSEKLLRDPIAHSFVSQDTGYGIAALSRITRDVFKAVGKPTSITCQPEAVVRYIDCRFVYPSVAQVWWINVYVVGGKIVKVSHIYLTIEALRAHQSKQNG